MDVQNNIEVQMLFIFFSVLAVKYNVVINRSVSAPGHGQSIIDGLNAVDNII